MAGTQDWLVDVLSSGGTTWTSDTAFYRPNDNLEQEITSTMQTVKLVNGSDAFIMPEVRRTKEPLSFFWAKTTSTFRQQLYDYINYGETIRITTHTGERYIGSFLSYKRVWFSGQADDFDVQAIFKETLG